mgnify:CR=1 FL=1|jgi:hypothetical protein|tara:strand:- start:2031 stop:2360 length:330 start_codon:yes stop_codon:yes gene_type:complete
MAGWKQWAIGEIVEAGDIQGFIQNQTVMVFDTAGARTTALTGYLVEGMVSYLKDTDVLEKYDGSSWVGLGGLPDQAANSGKFLTTDGTDASWAEIVTDPNPQIFMMMGA